MNITQTGYRPRNATAPCRKAGPIAGNGHVHTPKPEASESYFFCEVGDNLYAIMLFPLRDEFVTVTLLLGPIDDGDEGMVDLSTALALLERDSLGGNEQGIREKKTPAILQKEMEEDDPAPKEPTKVHAEQEDPRPKPGPNPQPAGHLGPPRQRRNVYGHRR
jgi:hypothetical protein